MISIISNNCWGAGYYQETHQQYSTPTVGLWFYPDDYLRLLSDLRGALSRPLTVGFNSKRRGNSEYPVGKLGDDIEIQFMHYKDEEEVHRKWSARVARLAASDHEILIKFDDRSGLLDHHLEQFDAIPFPRKVAFLKRGRWKVANYSWAIEVDSSANEVADGVALWKQTRNLPIVSSLYALTTA
jgi:uncharacterized protein (DUF1919 family)